MTSQLPTKTSQLTNDSGYITDSVLSAVAKSGSYDDLSNKPTNLVTTDTVQTITGKKTLKSTNPYYWAEIGVIDDTNVPGISFKDNYSKVNVYRDSNGIMRIETPSYGTKVQIKNILIEGKGDGSNTIKSISQSNKLHLGDAAIPISTLYATNLSDGTTTKTMTEVLSGTTEE